MLWISMNFRPTSLVSDVHVQLIKELLLRIEQPMPCNRLLYFGSNVRTMHIITEA